MRRERWWKYIYIYIHLLNTGASPRTMCYSTRIQTVLRVCANVISNLVLPSISVCAPSKCRVSFVFYNDIIASTAQTQIKRGKWSALNSGKCSSAHWACALSHVVTSVRICVQYWNMWNRFLTLWFGSHVALRRFIKFDKIQAYVSSTDLYWEVNIRTNEQDILLIFWDFHANRVWNGAIKISGCSAHEKKTNY